MAYGSSRRRSRGTCGTDALTLDAVSEVEPPDEPDAVAHIAELTGEQNANLAATIRAGMANGSARSGLDPDDLATAFCATLNGLLALAWRHGAQRADHDRLARLLAMYIATVADGFRTR